MMAENEYKSSNKKKPFLRGGLVGLLWLLAGVGTIVLFGAAMQKKEHQLCSDIKIGIKGVEQDMFIDETDVMDLVSSNGNITRKSISNIDLKALETALKKNLWVKNAEMFFDNNQVLHIEIEERQPVARVFTAQGSSFYLDSGALRLPLSDKFSARVPVFTGFPSDKPFLSQPDSVLLKEVVQMGKYIVTDSFWMAQVAQIDITPKATFELVPTIGNQVIEFGNADSFENKFIRLYTFYKQAWLQNGINKYEKLDVQYENQVVAVKRGTGKALMDSAKALQMFTEVIKQDTQAGSDSNHVAATANNIIAKIPVTEVVKLPNKPLQPEKKKLIDNAQNKLTSHTLSVSHKPLLPVNERETVPQKKRPKAVMKKDQ